MSKAKFVQPSVDSLISKAQKQDSVNTRREIAEVITDVRVAKKLFNEIAARYASRKTGFTTRTLLGRRRGDSTEMVTIELMPGDVEVAKPVNATSASKASAKKTTKTAPKSKTETKEAATKKEKPTAKKTTSKSK